MKVDDVVFQKGKGDAMVIIDGNVSNSSTCVLRARKHIHIYIYIFYLKKWNIGLRFVENVGGGSDLSAFQVGRKGSGGGC